MCIRDRVKRIGDLIGRHVHCAAFIDLEKAFDRVPRELLWRELRRIEYGIPEKLLKAVKSTYVDSKCRVKTISGEGEWFNVTTRVKQGSVLSNSVHYIHGQLREIGGEQSGE